MGDVVELVEETIISRDGGFHVCKEMVTAEGVWFVSSNWRDHARTGRKETYLRRNRPEGTGYVGGFKMPKIPK